MSFKGEASLPIYRIVQARDLSLSLTHTHTYIHKHTDTPTHTYTHTPVPYKSHIPAGIRAYHVSAEHHALSVVQHEARIGTDIFTLPKPLFLQAHATIIRRDQTKSQIDEEFHSNLSNKDNKSRDLHNTDERHHGVEGQYNK